MAVVVQINFNFEIDSEALRQSAEELAPTIAGVDGLLWKIWLIDDHRKVTGGIYLFDSREQATAYVQGEIVAGLRQAFPNIDVKIFDVMAEPGRVTRAPLPS